MSDTCAYCTPAVNLITTRTFWLPSVSAISITLTSLRSLKIPVPKKRLDFSAAIIISSAAPLQGITGIPSKNNEPKDWLFPLFSNPFAPTPPDWKPPKARVYARTTFEAA